MPTSNPDGTMADALQRCSDNLSAEIRENQRLREALRDIDRYLSRHVGHRSAVEAYVHSTVRHALADSERWAGGRVFGIDVPASPEAET